MKSTALLAIVLIAASSLSADDALAQRRSGGLAGPIELGVTYGSMWGGNVQLYQGKLRTATGGSFGVTVDIPLHEFGALELSYTRQDGGLDWDARGGKQRLTNMSVNYWHIGGVKTLMDGPIRPFVSTTLGVTYYSPSESTVTIEGETFDISTMTKFSLALGVGAKAYFGQNERFGLRASFRVLPTFYDAGAGVWFGTGGVSLGVGGSALWQWEAAGGLTIAFGG